MPTAFEIKTKLEKGFDKRQADVLAKVISYAVDEPVKTSNFNELKFIVEGRV